MNSINCIICNSDKNILYKSFIVKQNDTDKKFTLVKCVCNFIYLNPRPDEIEISKYYDNNYYLEVHEHVVNERNLVFEHE